MTDWLSPLRPISLEHQAVLKAFTRKPEVRVGDIVNKHHKSDAKAIYNVFGYLVRKGKIKRVSRGVYKRKGR